MPKPSRSATNSALASTSTDLRSGSRQAQHRRAARAGSASSRPRPRAPRACRPWRCSRRCARSAAPGCGCGGIRRCRSSCIRPPKKPRSPMPVFSFGERKNGWLKSSGLSSSQTLSSFCQTVSRPSLRLRVLDHVGERPQRRRRAATDRRRSRRPQRPRRRRPGRPRPRPAPMRPRPGRRGAGAVDGGLQGRAAGQHGAGGDEQGRARESAARAASVAMRKVLGENGRRHAFDGKTRSRSSRNGRNSQSRRRIASADQCIGLKRSRFGFAPSSPRRFFLSASYSW